MSGGAGAGRALSGALARALLTRCRYKCLAQVPEQQYERQGGGLAAGGLPARPAGRAAAPGQLAGAMGRARGAGCGGSGRREGSRCRRQPGFGRAAACLVGGCPSRAAPSGRTRTPGPSWHGMHALPCALLAAHAGAVPCPPAATLQIQNALSRQRKEETVEQLEGLLKSSAVVVGLRYQGLTVKQLQEFRRSLPQESKMLVCKVRRCRRAAAAASAPNGATRAAHALELQGACCVCCRLLRRCSWGSRGAWHGAAVPRQRPVGRSAAATPAVPLRWRAPSRPCRLAHRPGCAAPTAPSPCTPGRTR